MIALKDTRSQVQKFKYKFKHHKKYSNFIMEWPNKNANDLSCVRKRREKVYEGKAKYGVYMISEVRRAVEFS